MKIVFMGNPEFAVECLDKLYENRKDEIVGVVSQPKNQVYERAKELGLPLYDLYSIPEADLYVVVAFKILPPEIYTRPRLGTFNVHASLLPQYRGAAPINWAIANGESVTGVTTFFLDEKVDTGNIILQKEVKIDYLDYFNDLYEKLKKEAPKVMLETIDLIEEGKVHLKSQVRKAPKIDHKVEKIDWTKSTEQVLNWVRAFPGSWTDIFGGTEVKIIKVWPDYNSKCNYPGEIKKTKKQLWVGTGDHFLEILELQPAGRKPMTALDFLNGRFCLI